MNFSLFQEAFAETTVPTGASVAHQPSPIAFILMWVGLLVILYFLMWRPQSKRMKEQRKMLASLNKGDEIATNGGVIGKITKIDDNFCVLTVSEGVDIVIQRTAVAAVLPKGTLKSL